MTSVDIAEFVKARLDEDEAMARRNIGAAPGSQNGLGDTEEHGPSYPQYPTYQDEEVDAADEYIGRFRPLRVLREVAAKRRRLERYLGQDGYDLPEGVNEGRDPDERERDEALKDALEYEVREDAAVWSDHPDYRQEWAP